MTNVESVPWSPALLRRINALLDTHRRVILGITGPPGSGKSVLAAAIVASTSGGGMPAVNVAMDGFHLADAELTRLGLQDRKGAIDTFDGHGYVALLERIRSQPPHVVYAPAFDRHIEQPVAGSVAVGPEARLVVTEGNYLLDDERPWPAARALMSEVWYVDTPWHERHRRLIARHRQSLRSPQSAEAWVSNVDEPNAERIEVHRGKADLVVTGSSHPPA